MNNTHKTIYIIVLSTLALTGLPCKGAGWDEQLADTATRSRHAIQGNPKADKKLLRAVKKPRFEEYYVAQKVKQALSHGANPNITDELGYTPILWAAENGYAEAIYQLINAGADIYATDRDGRSALMHAVTYRRQRVVNQLMQLIPEKNINEYINRTDKDGVTVLLMASAAGIGNDKIITQFLAAGADANVIHPLGLTSLMLAVMNHNPAAVQALLKGGADRDIANPLTGETALDIAIQLRNAALRYGNIDALKNDPDVIVNLLTMGG